MNLPLEWMLQLAAPVITTTAFFTSYCVRFPEIESSTAMRRAGLVLCLITLVFATASSIAYIACSLTDRTDKITTESIAGSLLQTLFWIVFSFFFVISNTPAWPCYAVGSGIAFLLDISMLALCISNWIQQRSQTVLIAEVLKSCSTLAVFAVSVLAITPMTTTSSSTDDETEPLLGHATSFPSDQDKEDDTDTDSESDSDSEVDIFSEKQQKAVQSQGGLWSYLRGFAVFLPYLWPSKNRRLQAYIGLIVVCTLSVRVTFVLYARQYGIMVDSLYEVAKTSGPIPWKEILLWFMFLLLQNDCCGFEAASEWLESRITFWSTMQLRIASFDHVMGLPMRFHDDKDSGEVIKAVEQAGSLSELMQTLSLKTIPFLLDIMVALWYGAVLLDIYATVVILYTCVAFTMASYIISVAMRKARRISASNARSESRTLYELISNWATVAYFNHRSYEQRRLAKVIDTAVISSQQENDLSIALFVSQELVAITGRLVISLLAAYRVSQGTIAIGNFIALNAYWDSITMPLWVLGHSFRQISSNLVDAERLLQLFQEKSELKDGYHVIPSDAPGSVDFSKVSFGYSDKITLDGLSFAVEPGQTVALVGETGAGKSTIMKLLLRFFDVSSGSITIDGTDIRDVTLSSLRDIFGFVPQAPALFNTSIMENVRYGNLGASDEQVFAACRAAAMHDRILTFPKGYATKVGERGVKLSGGELQRIAIARVILKDPRIVLLDEATSALDTETEHKIQGALRALTKGRTTVVIAHRLSTVVDADLILVLEGGKVVERGSHLELLGKGEGRYREFWERQTSSNRAVTDEDEDGNGRRD